MSRGPSGAAIWPETRYRREATWESSREPSPIPGLPCTRNTPRPPGASPSIPRPGARPRTCGSAWPGAAPSASYQDRPLTQEELAALLWATQGVTWPAGSICCGPRPPPGPSTRWRPTWRCTGWRGWSRASGTSRCRTLPWSCSRPGTAARPWWGPGCPRVSWAPPAVVFIWTGVLNRAMWKYRERAIRYLFLDAGHICQNLMLAATALGLGVCPVGAFFDEEVEAPGPGGRRRGSGPLPGRGGAVGNIVFSFELLDFGKRSDFWGGPACPPPNLYKGEEHDSVDADAMILAVCLALGGGVSVRRSPGGSR